jgi:hypothetical protein
MVTLKRLLHEPSVADHDGLAGERIRWERRQNYRYLRHVLFSFSNSAAMFTGLLSVAFSACGRRGMRRFGPYASDQ